MEMVIKVNHLQNLVNRTVLQAASPFGGFEKDAPQSMMLKPASNTEACLTCTHIAYGMLRAIQVKASAGAAVNA